MRKRGAELLAGSMADAHPLGLLLDAVDFAARKHSNQRRKDPDKTPYINHPIGVAHLLWKVGGVTDLPTLQVSIEKWVWFVTTVLTHFRLWTLRFKIFNMICTAQK